MMRMGEKEASQTSVKRPKLDGDAYEMGISSQGSSESKEPGDCSKLRQTVDSTGPADCAIINVAPPNSSSGVSILDCCPEGDQQEHSGLTGFDDSDSQDSSQSTSPRSVQNDAAETDSQGNSDDLDDLSELSNLSGLSEEAWQPVAGPISWVQRQMAMGSDPRSILQELIPANTEIPPEYDQLTLWKIIINLLSEPPPRQKLPHINTLEDVITLLKCCQKIMVLTGAGVSVSCGIPDFRSRDGIYARLAKDFTNLPDPQAMFDIQFFRSDQRPFFKFAKEIYPGQFEPSLCHKFIKLIEDHGKLLRNYTQNIDTLEQVAGVKRVIQCHGSFATATCMMCKYKVDAEAIRKDIFDQVIPRCPKCPSDVPLAVMKPDIVFFGESLPGEFHRQMASDKDECDLLIVIGSSLKVRPVALIPNSLPSNVPQILINREPLRNLHFDVELLGNCDDIVSEICKRLGVSWDHLAPPVPLATQVLQSDLPPSPAAYEISAFLEERPPRDKKEVSKKKLSSDVIEHNTDSGLGDVEPVSSSDSKNIHDRCSCMHGSSVASSGRRQRWSPCNSEVDMNPLPGLESVSKPADKSISTFCSTYSSTSKQSVASHQKASSEHTQDRIALALDPDQMSVVKRASETDCKTIPCGEQVAECSSVGSNKVPHEVEHVCSTTDFSCGIKAKNTVSHLPHAPVPYPGPNQPDSTVKESHHTHKHWLHCSGSEMEGKVDFDREMRKDNAHCSHNDTMDDIRRTWIPKRRLSKATKISDHQFLYLPPSRYIFHGAEVYSDDGDSDSDDSMDDSDPSTSEHENSNGTSRSSEKVVKQHALAEEPQPGCSDKPQKPSIVSSSAICGDGNAADC